MSSVIPELLFKKQLEVELLVRDLNPLGTIQELRRRLWQAIIDGTPIKIDALDNIDALFLVERSREIDELESHVESFIEDPYFGQSRQILAKLKHLSGILGHLGTVLDELKLKIVNLLKKRVVVLFIKFKSALHKTPDPLVNREEQFKIEVQDGDLPPDPPSPYVSKCGELKREHTNEKCVEVRLSLGDQSINEQASATDESDHEIEKFGTNELLSDHCNTSLFKPLPNPTELMLQKFQVTDGLDNDELYSFIGNMLDIARRPGVPAHAVFELILPYTEDPLETLVSDALINSYTVSQLHTEIVEYFWPPKIREALRFSKFSRRQRKNEHLSSYICGVKKASRILQINLSELDIIEEIITNTNELDKYRLYRSWRMLYGSDEPLTFKDLDRMCTNALELKYKDEKGKEFLNSDLSDRNFSYRNSWIDSPQRVYQSNYYSSSSPFQPRFCFM